jgi:lysophospholipase L1-like esterase
LSIDQCSRACWAFLATVCLLCPRASMAVPAASPAGWVAAWTASPEAADADPDEPLLHLQGQTVREQVRLSVGGSRVRIRLSNEYGATPIRIGAATANPRDDPARGRSGPIQPLRFEGRSIVTIPAGGFVLSDPVAMVAAAGSELSVSLYFPDRVETPTLHALALKDAVITPPGDETRAREVEAQAISKSWILISQILVPLHPGQRVVAAFGDSLVDGDGSTHGADHNWPSDLARRLAARPGPAVAVLNSGIAGNRLLADGPFPSLGISGEARFERDVLSLPGLTHVILEEGVNDIGFPGASLHGFSLADPATAPTADDLTAGYSRLIAKAHARGIKVIGVTITPFEGVDVSGYYSDRKNAIREAVNRWIRSSGAFDAVLDFDAIVRDPTHPTTLRAEFASADHLHPNDKGYQAIADSVDLSLFQ